MTKLVQGDAERRRETQTFQGVIAEQQLERVGPTGFVRISAYLSAVLWSVVAWIGIVKLFL